MWLTREAPVEAVDVDGRTVTVRLCKWDDPRDVVDPDGSRYREQFPPGSLELAANVHVNDRHEGDFIGRALPETFDADGDGPTVELVIAHTRAGDDTLALIDAGVHRSVSMEFEGVTADAADGLLTRTRSIVHGLAFAFRPAHDAPILAVREQPKETTVITDTPTLDPPDTDSAPVVGEILTVETLNRELENVERRLIAASSAPGGSPMTRYRSLGEAWTAAYDDKSEQELLHRALADQITTNNPGVIPPAWQNTVVGIIARGRPTVTAFGVEDPGPVGMDVNWPYFDGDLTTLVGLQATQKTAITSVRVDLKKGTKALATYAGGSDISVQLIMRSQPSYRDAYMQIMYAAYAAVTDKVAALAVTGGAGQIYDIATADPTGALFRAALFAASIKVETATGQPASFALAASDVFVKIGGFQTVYPSQYGTNNATGTGDAASLNVNVSGIQIIHDPFLNAGELFVSNSLAASWYEDGPRSISATDVERLGESIAVFGLGAFAAHIPLGIVQLNATGTPTALEAREAEAEKAAKADAKK